MEYSPTRRMHSVRHSEDVGQVLGVDDVAFLLELVHDLDDVQSVVEAGR
ncbi:hypothetical protein [Streptomyces sp. NBC_00212]